MSKGSRRRPGTGYEENYDMIFHTGECNSRGCSNQLSHGAKYCSRECWIATAKKIQWNNADKEKEGSKDKVFARTDGDRPEDYDWSLEEDSEYYSYLRQCAKIRLVPLTFEEWRKTNE